MFEVIIIVALLIAMIGSRQPYQFAIVIALLTAVFLRPIESFGLYWAESVVNLVPGLSLGDDPVWIPIDIMFIYQTFMAGVLILYSFALKKTRERRFFLYMAAFLLFANALIPAYRFIDMMSVELYTILYRGTAILQVLMVFYNSHGCSKLIRSLRDSFFRDYANILGIRH